MVLILPWNLRDEIAAQLVAALGADGADGGRAWGGRFATAVPTLRVVPAAQCVAAAAGRAASAASAPASAAA